MRRYTWLLLTCLTSCADGQRPTLNSGRDTGLDRGPDVSPNDGAADVGSDPLPADGATQIDSASDSALDNNSDAAVDSGVIIDWRADCDCDGFAAAGAITNPQALRPSAVPGGCTLPPSCSNGGWASNQPVAGQTDCDDVLAVVNPGNQTGAATAIASGPKMGTFDYDCDGSDERVRPLCPSPSCNAVSEGLCVEQSCFNGNPACGASGVAYTTCNWSGAACTSSTNGGTVACR